MSDHKKIDALINGLNTYIANGYVEPGSFNDPNDDALEALILLLQLAEEQAFDIIKCLLNANTADYSFMKSVGLNRLLLSEIEWPYAFDYLLNKAGNISVPELEKALFYFYCAKNETNPHPVPDGLFNKLIARYQEVKDNPDADFYHLHEAYNNFIKAYALKCG